MTYWKYRIRVSKRIVRLSLLLLFALGTQLGFLLSSTEAQRQEEATVWP